MIRVKNRLKNRQEYYYNKRHGTNKPLPELEVGDTVWVQDLKKYGMVVKKLPYRSYVIRQGSGIYRRNRKFLTLAPPGRQAFVNESPADSFPVFNEGGEKNSKENRMQPDVREERSQTSNRHSERVRSAPVWFKDYYV